MLLDWFKKQLKRITNDVENLEDNSKGDNYDNYDEEVFIDEDETPYKYAFKVVNTITVILQDGTPLSKIDEGDFEKIKNSRSERELKSYFYSLEIIKQKEDEKREEKERQRKNEDAQKASKHLETISIDKDFVILENEVRYKNIDRTLPFMLIKKFSQLIEKRERAAVEEVENINIEILSLKRFWLWCVLNPRAEVADDLYQFLENNQLRLNKQGFFYSLRNVIAIGEMDNTLILAITNFYNKIKAIWKKKPSNFTLYINDIREYQIVQNDKISNPYFQGGNNEIIGNLQELTDNLSNIEENRYTDAHTRTMDIRIGTPVTMPPEKCSWSTKDCGEAGLHFTMDINAYGMGDTTIMVLINPMKVVGIGTQKGRCYEYLPVMIVPESEANAILKDESFDTLQLDEWYANKDLETLEDTAKTNFSIEEVKYQMPSIINIHTIKTVVKELSEMKIEISDRVQNLD